MSHWFNKYVRNKYVRNKYVRNKYVHRRVDSGKTVPQTNKQKEWDKQRERKDEEESSSREDKKQSMWVTQHRTTY